MKTIYVYINRATNQRSESYSPPELVDMRVYRLIGFYTR